MINMEGDSNADMSSREEEFSDTDVKQNLPCFFHEEYMEEPLNLSCRKTQDTESSNYSPSGRSLSNYNDTFSTTKVNNASASLNYLQSEGNDGGEGYCSAEDEKPSEAVLDAAMEAYKTTKEKGLTRDVSDSKSSNETSSEHGLVHPSVSSTLSEGDSEDFKRDEGPEDLVCKEEIREEPLYDNIEMEEDSGEDLTTNTLSNGLASKERGTVSKKVSSQGWTKVREKSASLLRCIGPHLDARLYHCEFCGKTFNHKGNFTSHKRSHSDYRPYKCDMCEKSFKEKRDLEKHKSIHSDLRPFQCTICDKSFKRASTLTAHEKIHLDCELFECDICGKSFKTVHYLGNHKKIHLDYKPFKCDLCDKCFSRNSSLVDHKRTHYDTRPFQCDLCEKNFKQSAALRTHRKIHFDDRPYQCGWCDKSFKQGCGLKQHEKIHFQNVQKDI